MSSSSSNPVLPAIATTLGAAVTQAYLLAAKPPAGRAPVEPTGWIATGSKVSGYLRLSQVWEEFGLWYVNGSDKTQMLLALRGTVTKADAEADGDSTTVDFVPAENITLLPTPKVHAGFYNLYTDTQDGVSTASMRTQILSALTTLAASGLSALYITGHSLGGALAELLSLDVALSGLLPKSAVQTINFAAPMVGEAANWGLAYTANVTTSFAVINQDDIVPTQPNLPGWGSVGTPFALLFFHNQNDFSKDELITRHSMSNHLFVLQQGIGLTPQQWAGSFSDSVFVGQSDTSADPTFSAAAERSASAGFGAPVITSLVAP